MSNYGGYMKEEAHDSATSSSAIYFKCYQLGHTMRDCHVLEVDHNRRKDQVGDQVLPVAIERNFFPDDKEEYDIMGRLH